MQAGAAAGLTLHRKLAVIQRMRDVKAGDYRRPNEWVGAAFTQAVISKLYFIVGLHN